MNSPEEDAQELAEQVGDDDGAAAADAVPAESNEEFISRAAGAFWQFGPGAGVNPEIAKNVTPDHIDKILENEDRHSERQLQDRDGTRRTRFWLAISGGIFLLALVGMLLFSGNEGITEDVLRELIVFLAGGFGGWGLGRRG